MKLSHIKLGKRDKNELPWRKKYLTLCGEDDVRLNTVDPFTFCTLPNDMRCQQCKQALLEMLE